MPATTPHNALTGVKNVTEANSAAIVAVAEYGGYVQITATGAQTATKKEISVEDADRMYGDMELRMGAVLTAINSLEHSVTPWGFMKNSKRASTAGKAIQDEQVAMKKLLSEMTTESINTRAELSRVQQMLMERTMQVDQMAGKGLQADQVHTQTYSNMQAKVMQLAGQVESMLANNEELLGANAHLEAEKEEAQKKTKEIGEKLKFEVEARDLQIRRLLADAKKETKKDEQKSLKQVSVAEEQLSSKVEGLQRRYDLSKAEAEAAKSSLRGLKEKVLEADALGAKSQEEIRTLHRKLADAKSENDGLVVDHDLAQKELAMFHSSFKSDATLASQRQHYNTTLAWPRVAYTTRGSKLVHSGVCGSMQASSCSPMEYHCHKELEAVVSSHAMMLCHNCCKEGRF